MIRAIVREGTVTRAADSLFLTQPAVSHSLRDLESRLRVQLFRRRKKRMEPTPEGFRLLQTAERVLDEIERAEYDLSKHREGKRGVLRVATQCYTAYHWLPRILRQFGELVPDVDIQIVPDATRDPVDALRAERIDLAILHEAPRSTGIAVTHLFEDEMVAIFPPGSLGGRQWVEPEEFADRHLLLHMPPEESLFVSGYLAPAGVEPRRVSQLALSEAIFESVRAGLGVSAVARWMAAAEIDAGHLCSARLAPDGLKRDWYVATLRKSTGLESVSVLTDLLRDESEHSLARATLVCATGA